jgi:hypothetical protein
MTTYVLSPSPFQKFFDNNGAPLANGLLFTYAAGTTNKLATAKDSTGTPNNNPIQLNARGECDLWIPPNVAFDYTLSPAGDTDPPTKAIKTIPSIIQAQLITLYAGVDVGVVNAYVLAFTAPFSSYTDGTIIYWTPSHTNTGPSTLNINGIGALNVTYPDGSSLAGGELVANRTVQVMVLGGAFILLGTTIIQGSFTPTWTGFSVAPTGAISYTIIGSLVTLEFGALCTGTSNATAMTITNLPAQLRPLTTTDPIGVPCWLVDNGAVALGGFRHKIPAGTLEFFKGAAPPSATGFTNPGTKGFSLGMTLSYSRG